jgi:ppGpp synthetase/RelA/SpoT-type nucleotidyltranferase
MVDHQVSQQLALFLTQQPLYQSIKDKVDKFEDRLKEKKIRFLWQSRVKTSESLQGKLQKRQAEGKDISISKLVDLIGARIVLFRNIDWPAVDELIKAECNLEEDPIQHPTLEEHCDRRGERFRGYDGLHYRTSLKSSNEQESKVMIEFQVVHILMWVYHEVEHTYGYKGDNTISNEVYRALEAFKGTANLNALVFEQFEAALEDQHRVPSLSNYDSPTPPFSKNHNLLSASTLLAHQISSGSERRQELLIEPLRNILQDILANSRGG